MFSPETIRLSELSTHLYDSIFDMMKKRASSKDDEKILRPCRYTQGYGPEYASEMFSVGYDEFGICGQGNKYLKGPRAVEWPMVENFQFVKPVDGLRFRQVVARSGFCIALTVRGEVYTWGNAWFGTLGWQPKNWTESISVPTKVPFFEEQKLHIDFIAASDCHCAAVATDGRLFLWGSNQSGQLGAYPVECSLSVVPRVVTDFVTKNIKIKQVACGMQHTVALSASGLVYCFGDNSTGLLGMGVEPPVQLKGIVPLPHRVPALSEVSVVFVCCGHFHSCALSETGELYTWGAGEAGQLGHNECRDMSFPKIVRGIGRPLAFATCSAFGTAAITTEGKLYVWGNNLYCRLGVPSGQDETVRLPTLCRALASKPLRSVSLGFFHGAAVSRNGDVYTWGQETYGCLGRDGNPLIPAMVKLPGIKISSVSCGRVHTILLTLPQKSIHLIHDQETSDPEIEAAGSAAAQRSPEPERQEAKKVLPTNVSGLPALPKDHLSELRQLQNQMSILHQQLKTAMDSRKQSP